MCRIDLGDGWHLIVTREGNFYWPLTASDEKQLVHEYEDDEFWYSEVLFSDNNLLQYKFAKQGNATDWHYNGLPF